MQNFDIVIAGGGPAGLLVASYLAKDVRTAVVERGQLGSTTKFWVTTSRRLSAHSLEPNIIHNAEKLTVGTFLGSEAFGIGDLVVVNERSLLNELISRAKGAGAILCGNQELISISWKSDSIMISTEKETYRCRLLIDATGGLSPVARTFRLHNISGFYTVYGAHLNFLDQLTNGVILAYVCRLGHPPPIFEVVPTSTTSAFCALFIATRQLIRPEQLKSDFQRHIEFNPFFKLGTNTTLSDQKMGAIPIGRMSRRLLPGLISLGEAALIQPPLLGSAFNEVLEHAKLIVYQILSALETSDKEIPKFRIKYPNIKFINDGIQRLFANIILNGNAETFDKISGIVSSVDENLLFRLFSNELGWTDISSVIPSLARASLIKTRR